MPPQPTTQPQNPGISKDQFTQMFNYAKANPNENSSKVFAQQIQSGMYNQFGTLKPQPTQQAPQQTKSLDPGSEYPKPTLQQASDAVSSIFPGKQVGQAIGTLAGAGIAKVQGNYDNYDLSAPTPLQVSGDIAQGALTVAAPGVGGETAATRIGANAALGAGIGATGAIAEGKSAGDVATSGIEGTTLGGGISALGEGVNALTKNLPNWFVQKALPKLNPDNVDFATKNLTAGTVTSNLAKSTQAVKSSGQTIDSILSHPQYESEVGNIKNVVNNTLDKYPNAQLDSKKIGSIIKNIVPAQKDLVEKVIDGTANLKDQNQLRQVLDKQVYPKFTDTPSLTFNKQIAKVFGDSLRENVQSTAPETKPIFENFAKEINLNQALQTAKTKIAKGAPVSLYDIVSGVGGGIPGIVAERAARTPAVLISAAKGIQAASKVTPAIQATGKVLKAPILKAATD